MKSLFSAVSVHLGSLPGPVPARWRCLSMVASIQRLRTGSWMMVSGPKILKCSRCHWSWSENTWMKFLEKHCVTLRLLWCSKVALNSILHLYTSTLKFSMESQYEQHSVAYSKPLQFEIACLYHSNTHTHTSMIISVYTYIFIWFHMYTCALRPQRGLGWILDTTCFEWKNAQFKSQSEEVKSSHWMPGQMFQVQNRFTSPPGGAFPQKDQKDALRISGTKTCHFWDSFIGRPGSPGATEEAIVREDFGPSLRRCASRGHRTRPKNQRLLVRMLQGMRIKS